MTTISLTILNKYMPGRSQPPNPRLSLAMNIRPILKAKVRFKKVGRWSRWSSGASGVQREVYTRLYRAKNRMLLTDQKFSWAG